MENNVSIFQYTIDNSDIVSIIKNYIRLEKKGQNYFGLCPFHNDKNPSLVVSPSKKIFKCFVCGETGNVIKFVEKFKKISLRDSLLEIFKLSNLDINYLNNNFKKNHNEELFLKFYKVNEQAANIYFQTLLESKNKNILDYLLKRKISLNIIKEFQIGYAPFQNDHKYLFSIMTNENKLFGEKRDKNLIWSSPDLLEANLIFIDKNNNYLDFFFNRLIIPIRNNNGNISGFSGRSLSPNDDIKYLNSKNSLFFQKENILFNFYNFDKTKFEEIYIVEGYMDVFSLKIIGVENVIGLMGTNLTSKNLNNIKKYKNINSIVLCLDNDEAGRISMEKNAIELIKNDFKVYIVKPFQSGIKDANDLINKFSNEEAKNIINDQLTFIEYEIYKHPSNLTTKEKIQLYNRIFSLLSEFPDSYLEKLDDIKKLSDFLDSNYEIMLEKFNIFRKNYFKQQNFIIKNNNFIGPSKKIGNKEIIYKSIKNKKISFDDREKEKNANYEKELIYLAINSRKSLELFFEYYYLNSLPFISKVYPKENLFYKEVVYSLAQMYNKNLKINYSNFIKFLQNNQNNSSFLEDFLNNKDIYKHYNEKEIIYQTYEIIKHLLNSKIHGKKFNLTGDKEVDTENIIEWNNIIKEYRNKLKKLKEDEIKYFNILK